MRITIEATGLELTPAMREFIEEKIGGIEKLIARFNANNSVLAAVEIARSTKHHRKGNVFHAEVNLTLPGKMLRAEDEDFDIRVAVDRVRDKLKREIEKYREQHAQ